MLLTFVLYGSVPGDVTKQAIKNLTGKDEYQFGECMFVVLRNPTLEKPL